MSATMREEFVNPFLSAAQEVWQTHLHAPLRFAGASATDKSVTTEDVTAFVGVTGQMEGNVMYGFQRRAAHAVLEAMTGSRWAGLDQAALDLLQDLVGKIAEDARSELASNGFRARLSVPALVRPKGSRFTTMGLPQILAEFESELGPLSIRVSLREITEPG